MKKLIALLLVLVTVFAFAACGNNNPTEGNTPADPTDPPVAAKTPYAGTLEELLNKLVEKVPVEFMGGVMPIDLTDTSEDGLWAVKSFTGLENGEKLTEAAVFEPMMGSIAYSLVTVRVKEGEDVQAVAQAMKNGIDTRKWICVNADDLQVATYCDVVMLIMVSSENGLASQPYVDALKEIVGADLDSVI